MNDNEILIDPAGLLKLVDRARRRLNRQFRGEGDRRNLRGLANDLIEIRDALRRTMSEVEE